LANIKRPDIISKKVNKQNNTNFSTIFMNLKNSFLSFYLVLVSFPIMSTNIIVPNEEILAKPFPLPYERVDLSESDLRNFIDDTINNNKQPVVIFGANWCPDCRILSAVLDLETVNEYMNDYFEILYIDLGRYDINMSLMEFFDIMPQQGIPRVVILNKDKEVLNIKDTGEWTTARSRTKQEIFNYFQEYKE
jgi:thiol-disulfide isomerase/thioredoxin